MVEMQTFCGIAAIHKTLRQWGSKFVQSLANQIRHRLPQADGKRHLGEVGFKINGVTRRLWRAVDQAGMVFNVLVQSREDKRAVKLLLRKLLKHQTRFVITDKLASYSAAKQR
jgi:putative transposase